MPTHRFRLDTPLTRESAFAALSFKGGVLTIRFAGPRVAEREAAIVSRETNDALETLGRRLRVLVLDLSDVQMMTSVGLGLCIDIRNSAKRLKAATILYGLCPQLEELLGMLKVDRLYKIAATEAELSKLLAA